MSRKYSMPEMSRMRVAIASFEGPTNVVIGSSDWMRGIEDKLITYIFNETTPEELETFANQQILERQRLWSMTRRESE